MTARKIAEDVSSNVYLTALHRITMTIVLPILLLWMTWISRSVVELQSEVAVIRSMALSESSTLRSTALFDREERDRRFALIDRQYAAENAAINAIAGRVSSVEAKLSGIDSTQSAILRSVIRIEGAFDNQNNTLRSRMP